jgi:integrase/recombinase XerD
MPKSKEFLRRNINVDLKEALEKYLLHCKAKNLAERTISSYEYEVGRFFNYLDKVGNIASVGDINSDIVENYVLYMIDMLDKKSSVNSNLRSVRAFCNYCMKNGYIKEKFKVNMLKTKKKIKETYSDKELKLLLVKPDLLECDFAEYRSWLMVNWIMSTGNRLRTIRNIKVKDLDFESGYIKLSTTKNRYQQIIPFGKELQKLVKEYLEYREGEDEDYLFCNIYGEKLSTTAVTSAIRRYNLNRGVSKTSTHLFRHTFAKKWILNGGDIFRLQKMLGHKSLEMVKEYVNMFGEDLKEDFEEFNPLNEFSKNKEYIKMR